MKQVCVRVTPKQETLDKLNNYFDLGYVVESAFPYKMFDNTMFVDYVLALKEEDDEDNDIC